MSGGIPTEDALLLAALLFVVGLAGVLLRRNLLFMLMSLELMLNGCALAFIGAGARWESADGQVMFVLLLALAAAEVGVALAIVVRIENVLGTVDADSVSRIRD